MEHEKLGKPKAQAKRWGCLTDYIRGKEWTEHLYVAADESRLMKEAQKVGRPMKININTSRQLLAQAGSAAPVLHKPF